MTPQTFVNKWLQTTLKERSASQEHFIDICALLGHPTPAADDPTGRRFTFEAGATKQNGGPGWADVWKKGFFAWEYKWKYANLDKAYNQLLQYREALQNPPLLIVSNMKSIVIHTNFTNTVKKIYTLTLVDLLEPAKLAILHNAFFNPQALRAPQTLEQVTQHAAVEFARLAEQLRQYGEDSETSAHFLIRLLFCLYAESVGLLSENLFTKLVNRTKNIPAVFHQQLQQLFDLMRCGGWCCIIQIPHFDGQLFDGAEALKLDRDGLRILAQASQLDWSSVEPAIFGTLFERSLDPSQRSQLGAHYTRKDDILLMVEPVLMAPLRRRWRAVQAEAQTLAQQLAQATTTRQRTHRQRDLRELLQSFAREIAAVQVLDPACGSGNFLYVALHLLLDLEKEVITLAGQLGGGHFFPTVSPEQLRGIEINPYAYELAQVTVWIGYIQWLQENGFGFPAEPILKPLDNIKRMDAILAYDEHGQPVEPAWPQADVIVGNPPFLGDKKMRGELGDKYVDDLRALYSDRIPGQSDLVCYWFENARTIIERDKLQRVGLLATQAIRGGANRVVLERIQHTGAIFWAQSDRDWILDGATVHVSMVGFDNGQETERQLDGQKVKKINPDLTSTVDLTVAQRLEENQGISFIGTQKSGAFDLPDNAAQVMLALGGNPNNRPNSDVIKRWINATDVTRSPRNMWVIDFGVDMSMEQASEYEAPFEYIKQHIKSQRDKVRRKNHREKWWLFGETRPGMRATLNSLSRYIVTPMVSKHRIFAWIPINVIPENLLVVIAREDDYFLGVLHSKLHELWTRRAGTQLRDAKSASRYTTSTCFATYPFPWPPGTEAQAAPNVEAIAQAARDLVAKRERWLNPGSLPAPALKKRTLTNLYNQRPTWLALAHEKLDQAVLDAYGWPHALSDAEILERLLTLNLERAKS